MDIEESRLDFRKKDNYVDGNGFQRELEERKEAGARNQGCGGRPRLGSGSLP